MADYKETTINGQYSEYQRSNKVIVMNELGGTPEITFMEQVIGTLPDGTKVTPRTTKCADQMTNPAESFPLLNPLDDSVIGSLTYQEVYVTLYSLYRYVAAKRDAAAVIPPEA